jgi:hypothetical protein
MRRKNIIMSTTIWVLILMGLKMNVMGCKWKKQKEKKVVLAYEITFVEM